MPRIREYFMTQLPLDMPKALKDELWEDFVLYGGSYYTINTDIESKAVKYERLDPMNVKHSKEYVHVAL